jgi:succinate dehydrogenase / fumarate reductase flavoprotein subunit
MAELRVIVVGGGIAGLMATLKACEAGAEVDLFSLVTVRRSHSLCAQGGINAVLDVKDESDSIDQHFEDTVKGGDFLANQLPIMNMVDAAPGLIHLMSRMGVTFSRTPEGTLDQRLFGGVRNRRTAFAGATTGQQILYGLDDQVRKYEEQGKVKKYERWNFLSAILDDTGRCRGIVAMDLSSMKVEAFKADVVVMATGGTGQIFGKSTMSNICTGSAAAALYRQGAYFANGEFFQIHPTAIEGGDKRRLVSEAVRGEGGRIWAPRGGERWYFLEEKYPAYGNLVPRDIASREIFQVVRDMGLGINGRDAVYLDVTHVEPKYLDRRLGGVLELYEKFTGENPKEVPMRIFPAPHYSMGGLWTDFGHKINIPGIFAVGECDYQFHGANRLGANSLLSASYAGYVGGQEAVAYLKGLETLWDTVPFSVLERERARWEERLEEIYRMDGPENSFSLALEMGEVMTTNMTVVRYNKALQETLEKLFEIRERQKKASVLDAGRWGNQIVPHIIDLENMVEIAIVMTEGALQRNESRGAHYKPEFPERDDENWLKTTMASYTEDGPKITYEDVDTSLMKPVKRDYTK